MSGQDVKSSGASDRYATALFELAEGVGKLDLLEGEMATLKGILATNAELTHFLASPVIGTSEKANAITAIANKAGFSTLTSNFTGVVASSGRAAELSLMVDRFTLLCAQARGAVHAEAVTAQPMSAKQEKDLAGAIKAALGQDVKIETRVDPALLGGLVVKIGSRMFDSSLKSKLEGLNLVMKES